MFDSNGNGGNNNNGGGSGKGTKVKSSFENLPSLKELLKGGGPLSGRKGPPIRSEVVEVTPELAKAWLEKNHPDNRPISKSRVDSFVTDLKNGDWILTHQAIAFNGEGYLIDGQHRLTAIVEAGISAKILIVYNQMASFHDPIDRGAPRSVGTILGVQSRVSASYNTLRMLEQGTNLTTPMTLAEAESIQIRHKDAYKAIEVIPMRNKLHGGFIGSLVWALPCAPDAVIEFGTRVATGELLRRGDAAFSFRNWKERNPRMPSWMLALAALNCARYHIHKMPISGVFTGEMGYRAFCSRRRALRIPNTPSAEVVPSGNWRP